MEGEEPAQRIRADDRTAQHQIDHIGTDDRHSTRHRCSDSHAPIRVGIPPHDLTGESHSHRQQQQNDARDPVQLAWVLESPMQKNLRHVHDHHDHHGRAGPVMQRAEKPTERLVFIQVNETCIRLACRGNVDKRQPDAGQDLNHEQRHGSAAENIPPAHRASSPARYGMHKHRGNRLAETQSRFKP